MPNGRTGISRREVLKSLAAAVAVAAGATPRVAGAARAQPAGSGINVTLPGLSVVEVETTHFFSLEEKQMIATVADLIIPTDEVSPGARAAGAHDWIDFVVANSPESVKHQWREGLRALDRSSEEMAGRKFLELSPGERQKLLEEFAQREDAPETPGERFFALAKEATVNGYYTSEIGLMKDLKFRGGTYVAEPDASCPASTRHASDAKSQ